MDCVDYPVPCFRMKSGWIGTLSLEARQGEGRPGWAKTLRLHIGVESESGL